MRTYPSGNLTREKIIFNYRLSRARRRVKNAFGILAFRLCCFHRPLMLTTKHVAAVVLHNFLRREVGSQYTEITSEIQSCNNQATQLTSMRRVGRSYSSTASNVREAFPVVVVVVYPTPSEGWGHGGRPWSPRSRETPQGLDQRS